MKYTLIAIACAMAALWTAAAAAQTAREVLGPAALVPQAGQPPARIVVDPPVAEALARGIVVIQYRVENLRIMPVYGPAALDVSPRIGHIHVAVDHAPWHWADASDEPVILVGLPAGPHKVQIDLADPTHRSLDRVVVDFVVPEAMAPRKP